MIHQVINQMLRMLYAYAERKALGLEPNTRRGQHAVGVVRRMADSEDDSASIRAGKGQGVGMLALRAEGGGDDAVSFVMEGLEFFSEMDFASCRKYRLAHVSDYAGQLIRTDMGMSLV